MNLSPAVADELNMELTLSGVVIARVDRGSVAERVGLRPRDRVLEVNGLRADDTEQLAQIAERRARGWDIVIDRDGRQFSLLLGG